MANRLVNEPNTCESVWFPRCSISPNSAIRVAKEYGLTTEELLLWVARGIAMSGLLVMVLAVFDLLPERRTFVWITWYALIGVAFSAWIGLETGS